jgi:hypothetical protein
MALSLSEMLALSLVIYKLIINTCANDYRGCTMLRMSKNYTTNEAARELGVTPGRVRQMIVDGLLKTERFGSVHVIKPDALKIAAARKTKPGPGPKAMKKGGKK